MKLRRILPLGVIGILAVGAVAYYMYNKPHKDMSRQKADVVTSAEDLWSDYSDTKHLGKIVQVEGKIREVSVEENNEKIILETSDLISGIVCQMDPLSQHPGLSQVKTGDVVVLKGQCSGMLMDIIIDRCIIIQ